MAWTGHPMRTGDPDIDGGNYHRDPDESTAYYRRCDTWMR